MRKGGARPGDQLYLSKPLGTGVITTAAKLTGPGESGMHRLARKAQGKPCLLYTSDAADERSSVDLGGRRIIKKKKVETKSSRPTR